MRHNVLHRSPVPGRAGKWAGRVGVVGVVGLVMAGWLTGCSIDEPLKPAPRPASRTEAASAPASFSADGLLRFDDLSVDSLWTHIRAARGIADVGVRAPGSRKGMDRGRVLISRAQRAAMGAALARVRGLRVLSADTLLPILQVRINTREALAQLRADPQVEYVEPGAFVNVNRDRALRWNDIEFGCSVSGYSGPANTWITPGDILPWNYRRMQIDSAWEKSIGSGVTIGIVDTGVDAYSDELTNLFSSGMSTGRTFVKEATKPASSPVNWHDSCGHGTRMASVIGAPRNGWGIVGVAWGANLYMVRVDDDVVLTEVAATREGIRLAAQHAPIIAMAFGTYASYSSIAQELSYWYYNSERLFFAAAGTGGCYDPWHLVTFPGTLETVTTVTAFDEYGGIACNSSRGWPVDFAAYSNQPAQGLSSLGFTMAGFSGSSNATGVLAGMAGLYLSTHPGSTRNQILTALTSAASPTGGRSPLSGFGAPNALCLMSEMCTAWIEGPNLIEQAGNYSWTVRQFSSPGPISYTWGSGETSQVISRSIDVYPGMPDYAFTINVTVRDSRNGRTRTDVRTIYVRNTYECPSCF